MKDTSYGDPGCEILRVEYEINRFSETCVDFLKTILPCHVLYDGTVYIPTDVFVEPMRSLRLETHVDLVNTCMQKFCDQNASHYEFEVHPYVVSIRGSTYIKVLLSL